MTIARKFEKAPLDVVMGCHTRKADLIEILPSPTDPTYQFLQCIRKHIKQFN